MKNIELRKQYVLNSLFILENECKTLLERIPTVRETVLSVHSLEDAKACDTVIESLFDGLEILRDI